MAAMLRVGSRRLAAALFGAFGAVAAQAAPALSSQASIAIDDSCRPLYPPKAWQSGARGFSHVRMTIDTKGRITPAEIALPSGPTRENRLMDAAALAALRTCTATPARDAAGEAADTTINIVYEWKLDPAQAPAARRAP